MGLKFFKKNAEEKKSPLRHFLLIVIGVFLFIYFGIWIILIAGERIYREKVLPGVFLGETPIGGLDRKELTTLLENFRKSLSKDGLVFKYEINGEIKNLVVYPNLPSDAVDNAIFDLNAGKAAERLISFGKEGGFFSRSLSIFSFIFEKPQIQLPFLKCDKRRFSDVLKTELTPFENLPENAKITVVSIIPLEYKISSENPGKIWPYDSALNRACSSLARFSKPEIFINLEEVHPKVTKDDILSIADRLPAFFENGGIELYFVQPDNRFEYSWKIAVDNVKDWLEVQKTENQETAFGLKKEAVISFLEKKVAFRINKKATDAKFSIDENQKVTEFQGSKSGIEVDMEKTYAAINAPFLERMKTTEVKKKIPVEFLKTEPNVQLKDINELGLKEVLGASIAVYSGSPVNRIKNIKNGVSRLSGALVSPGEEFSALKYVAPFTEEEGYVPEYAIKGDRIELELGGGICHVSTTLFRAVMNSGLKITQRQNHSLMLSYYNDWRNGLPGTDATIYEPEPDFRFLNDTGNYVIVEAEASETAEEIIINIWGTSDGRKGYYLAPTVEYWLPAGPIKTVKTKTLNPGQKKCQLAYQGAKTSFIYMREFSSGSKEETIFESYYRPLPPICLVGVK